MLWQSLKTASAASPDTIASKLSALYGLQRDDRSAWK